MKLPINTQHMDNPKYYHKVINGMFDTTIDTHSSLVLCVQHCTKFSRPGVALEIPKYHKQAGPGTSGIFQNFG